MVLGRFVAFIEIMEHGVKPEYRVVFRVSIVASFARRKLEAFRTQTARKACLRRHMVEGYCWPCPATKAAKRMRAKKLRLFAKFR
jgi:hypothetical protein